MILWGEMPCRAQTHAARLVTSLLEGCYWDQPSSNPHYHCGWQCDHTFTHIRPYKTMEISADQSEHNCLLKSALPLKSFDVYRFTAIYTAVVHQEA
jgi:hypothetical protein